MGLRIILGICLATCLASGCSRNMNPSKKSDPTKPNSPTVNADDGGQAFSNLEWSLSMVAFMGDENLVATETLVLMNKGSKATSALNFTWRDSTTVFAEDVNNCQGQVLRANESCTMVISYNPTLTGVKNNLLSVLSNNETKSIIVTKLVSEEQSNTPVITDLNLSTVEDVALTAKLIAIDPKGLTLTYVANQLPIKGTLNLDNTTGSFTYTPNANTNGVDTFTFKVINSAGYQSGLATVKIDVLPQNDGPVAKNDSVVVLEDQSILIDVIHNDLDVENDGLTIANVFTAAHGTAVVQANKILYTPNANYFGSDSFLYEIVDVNGTPSQAVVAVQVVAVNDKPTLVNQTFSGTEDNTLTGQVAASDVDGNSLTYILVSSTAVGSLTLNGNGSFSYVPTADFVGAVSFVVKVNDGHEDSATATMTLTLVEQNDNPVAQNQQLTTPEDTNLNITLSATDDQANLIYTIQSNPLHGIILGSGNQITYKPNANYTGSDQIVFKATDASGGSGTGIISLTVTAVNDPPIVDNQSFSTDRNQTLNAQLVAADPENDSLTFTIVSQPASGTLILTNASVGLFTYVPNNNFTGNDSFTFKVGDGTLTSAVFTATINVHDGNQAPTTSGGSLTVDEDDVYGSTLVASDADNDSLTYSVTTQGTKGLVTITNPATGAFTYTPYANLYGSDSFKFRVNDGRVNSNESTVSVSISSINDLPEAFADAYNTNRNQAKAVVLVGFDIEQDPLTYIITQSPTLGVLTGSGNTLTYTPNAGASGADSFYFKVNDGTNDSPAVKVDMVIANTNTLPVANNFSISLLEDGNRADQLTATDADGDPLTYTLTVAAAHGTAVITSGNNFTYTPTANYFGSDTFKFKANDGFGDSNEATVTITVTGVNDLPTTSSQSLTTEQNQEVAITLAAVDMDGQSLTYTIVTPPTKGTLSGTAPSLTYTPALNNKGSDSFSFKVNDGVVDSNTSTVSLTITDNGDWAYPAMVNRRQISLNNTDVAALTNVPVLLSLTSDTIDYNDFKSGGEDIRFTDADGNALKYQIINWNPAGTSQVYVQAAAVTANSTISKIWMYYNNSLATSASTVNTWNNGTVASYSLEDAAGLVDSTGRNSVSAQGGTLTTVSGVVGAAVQFANGSYVEWNNNSFNLTNQVSVSFWVYVNSVGTSQTLIKQGKSGGGSIYAVTAGSNKLTWTVGSKSVSSNTLSSGVWYHVGVSYNQANTTCAIYVNGILHNQNTGCSDTFGATAGGLILGNTFAGAMDEVKVDNQARAVDWFRAQYLSMNNSYFFVGQNQVKGNPVIKQMLLAINHTNNDGEVNANGIRSNSATELEQGQSNTLLLIPNDHWGYYRFALNEALPASAQILTTTLKLYGTNSYSWDSNADSLSVWLQDSANAGQVSGNNQYPGAAGISLINSGLWWTSTGLAWKSGGWNQTANLNTNLQTLLANHSGISQNNYLQFWVTRGNSLGGLLNGIKKVSSEDYSNNNFNQAQVFIEWQ